MPSPERIPARFLCARIVASHAIDHRQARQHVGQVVDPAEPTVDFNGLAGAFHGGFHVPAHAHDDGLEREPRNERGLVGAARPAIALECLVRALSSGVEVVARDGRPGTVVKRLSDHSLVPPAVD